MRAGSRALARSMRTTKNTVVWNVFNNSFDSERYVLTYKNKELREFAALAPYDALILLANSNKYGGGGIFNLWCTAAAASAQTP